MSSLKLVHIDGFLDLFQKSKFLFNCWQSAKTKISLNQFVLASGVLTIKASL